MGLAVASALSFARWSVSMPFARCNLPSRFVLGLGMRYGMTSHGWCLLVSCSFVLLASVPFIQHLQAHACVPSCVHAWLCDVTTLAPQDCLWGKAAWARAAWAS